MCRKFDIDPSFLIFPFFEDAVDYILISNGYLLKRFPSALDDRVGMFFGIVYFGVSLSTH
jgi:hypothetical protein